MGGLEILKDKSNHEGRIKFELYIFYPLKKNKTKKKPYDSEN